MFGIYGLPFVFPIYPASDFEPIRPNAPAATYYAGEPAVYVLPDYSAEYRVSTEAVYIAPDDSATYHVNEGDVYVKV